MQYWPTILRILWLCSAIGIGIYTGGSVIVSPTLPNGWPNPGFVVVPFSALFALALILRHRHAWIAGSALVAVGIVSVLMLNIAYGQAGWKNVAPCLALLLSLYSIWDLKAHNDPNGNIVES